MVTISQLSHGVKSNLHILSWLQTSWRRLWELVSRIDVGGVEELGHLTKSHPLAREITTQRAGSFWGRNSRERDERTRAYSWAEVSNYWSDNEEYLHWQSLTLSITTSINWLPSKLHQPSGLTHRSEIIQNNIFFPDPAWSISSSLRRRKSKTKLVNLRSEDKQTQTASNKTDVCLRVSLKAS